MYIGGMGKLEEEIADIEARAAEAERRHRSALGRAAAIFLLVSGVCLMAASFVRCDDAVRSECVARCVEDAGAGRPR